MPSPLPGMDPWLESPAIFPDLQNSLIAALRDSINALLPPPFFAAIANRVWIEQSERRVEPDVDILKPSGTNGSPWQAEGTLAASATTEMVEVKPVIIKMPREEFVEWTLEIHAAPGGHDLVTSVEVLSLSYKTRGGKGWRLYRKKQREMRRGRVNLVEIDLLRGGIHATAVSLNKANAEVGSFDYHVCVHRFNKREDFEVYPIQLSQRLPKIAVPLLPEMSDVVVSLQDTLAACYDRGLYSRRVRYDRACEPPLSVAQQKWANEILRNAMKPQC